MSDLMPESYFEAFGRLLGNVLNAKEADRFPELAAFRIQLGRSFDPTNDLLVIGRATNGWDDCRFRTDGIGETLRAPDELLCLLRQNYHIDPKQQMSWARKSAFWWTVRDVLCELNPGYESDWPDHLCWTNLAKIAPVRNGNPSNALWNAQVRTCSELLRIEVEALAPQRILILAGCDWYGPPEPFLDTLGIECHIEPSSLVQAVAKPNEQVWVFCKHPQGKPKFVNEIAAQFRSS